MAYGKRETEGVATLADIEALPEGVVGEIIEGTLYVHAQPRAGHMDTLGGLHAMLWRPFQKGSGGPGGWWIQVEPGIQLEGSPEFIPDVAGWRKDRVARIPTGSWLVAPDWACEILSPSTRAYDLRIKRPFYARIGIKHLWFIDLDARTLLVSELREGQWVEVGTYCDEDVIRVPPFEDLELRLGELWPLLEPTSGT
ncbi:Uma2 family endonuclease [Myxococcus sp. AS-1-15]|uniref:Uma2 family endonuclease n=1 Tax=Myxococcus sp. AS-1-15 TaxID=2874600 RepID=UPI001CBF3E4D|nr:Uma2 family endonuclease [Myxococcus sp. AS-1-15]MBZ4396271.1 Uma2 family endonuclease [Myxococcus sp. AS-1-15]